MHVLNDCYYAQSHECLNLSAKHKATIFGRLKNVLAFADDFRKELEKALGGYENVSEEQINEAQLDQLTKWDKDTTAGDVFWSSVPCPCLRLLMYRWCGLKKPIRDIVLIMKRLPRRCRSWRK